MLHNSESHLYFMKLIRSCMAIIVKGKATGVYAIPVEAWKRMGTLWLKLISRLMNGVLKEYAIGIQQTSTRISNK